MENNNIAEAQWEHHLEYNDEMLQRRAGFIAGYNRALSLAYDWIMAEAYAFMPKEKAEEFIGIFKEEFGNLQTFTA